MNDPDFGHLEFSIPGRPADRRYAGPACWDAVALVQAFMDGDEEGIRAVLHSSRSPGYLRHVAAALAGMVRFAILSYGSPGFTEYLFAEYRWLAAYYDEQHGEGDG